MRRLEVVVVLCSLVAVSGSCWAADMAPPSGCSGSPAERGPVIGGTPDRAAASAGERRLEGRWLIVQMVRKGKPVERPDNVRMTMSFRSADHSWLLTIETGERSFSEAGSWRLDGSRLVTKSEDGSKVERMRVRSIGEGVLELKKTDERLVLKRQDK